MMPPPGARELSTERGQGTLTFLDTPLHRISIMITAKEPLDTIEASWGARELGSERG